MILSCLVTRSVVGDKRPDPPIHWATTDRNKVDSSMNFPDGVRTYARTIAIAVVGRMTVFDEAVNVYSQLR